MEQPRALERLVGQLRLCKRNGHRPYTLLLTSSVPFPEQVRQKVCGSPSWRDFQSHLQGIGARERITTLTNALQADHLRSGYLALASLIKWGYFSTVVMCNVDAQLEEALSALGCQAQVLIVGKDQEAYLAAALEGHREGICLLKLHGCLGQGILPPAYPSFQEVPRGLQDFARGCLNRDMLVIGSIAPDQDVARLLAQHLDNSLYYILPGPPDAYDRVCDTIEGRGLKLENYLVQGEWGEFNTFFGTLARKLAEDAPPVSGEPTQEWSRGRSTTQADVLLVTVTKIETEAVLELFPDYRPLHHADQTYYDLGLVQGARVFLVQQSTMGTGSPGGSLLTIFKGIHTLAPRTVIMVGIAFGFDETRQVLGDVLVSDQIQTYEQQRVGSGEQKELVILARGARPAVSPRLLSRFKSGAQSWQAARVFFGLILSGEKLIDHEGYRNQLRQFAPEALGGEMEGTGLHVAAEAHTLAHKVEWILVKAICDWADGNKELNKDRNQQQAARNAARFVCHVLQQGGFIN